MNRPVLQVALDLVELDRAVTIAGEAVAGGADWLEAGTPLIKSEGMRAVSTLKATYPDHTIIADMKTADTGAIEVEMAAKSGADIVCVLGASDDSVIAESVRAARKYGVKIMADLISVTNPAIRASELEQLGVDYLCAHTGIDQQMTGTDSLDLLLKVIHEVTIPVAAAGGISEKTSPGAIAAGAKIVIVGGSIIRSSDVSGSTRRIREAMDKPLPYSGPSKNKDEEIREILTLVSSSNVSDAMHRKGAMTGLFSVCQGTKAVGKAVTVQTFAGDWAKPVEAIDLAGPGDIIVINNDQGTRIAPWGELATISCINRGISGVVIDGAARDIDDIRKMKFPIWVRALAPNAGEPKGFGEIGAEISCCGQTVNPGDWIIGDDSGVVVIPKTRAYEITRRAKEVYNTELRIREELHRGKSLSQVMNLIRWEKK
ncbi:3-hexulose-6-phosphate synthase [Methanospirillum stamsii]|uniref:3-hexulose-6-phosphate synthase n=1 Tax=Methanospirillum stamsii TaxID=1277351 RepID=A0A2V2MQU2_9EURY|nr:3-hexulose-6-phosphate synthase [Methanospirillum stamsii]PWR69759.1 bifunctional hexulose-6-phosphate synthase/ribonuclease regulator [Methanospirillum stamsii]